MLSREFLHSLEFDDDCIIAPQVGDVGLLDRLALVVDLQFLLGAERDSAQACGTFISTSPRLSYERSRTRRSFFVLSTVGLNVFVSRGTRVFATGAATQPRKDGVGADDDDASQSRQALGKRQRRTRQSRKARLTGTTATQGLKAAPSLRVAAVPVTPPPAGLRRRPRHESAPRATRKRSSLPSKARKSFAVFSTAQMTVRDSSRQTFRRLARNPVLRQEGTEDLPQGRGD